MKNITLIILAVFFVVTTGICQSTILNQDSLYNAFVQPPNQAKPRVWWHWMNGNITKNGIQKDLEWMQRVGIGGFQNFDANLFTPQVVEKATCFHDTRVEGRFPVCH